jgi:hypothetical protein
MQIVFVNLSALEVRLSALRHVAFETVINPACERQDWIEVSVTTGKIAAL